MSHRLTSQQRKRAADNLMRKSRSTAQPLGRTQAVVSIESSHDRRLRKQQAKRKPYHGTK